MLDRTRVSQPWILTVLSLGFCLMIWGPARGQQEEYRRKREQSADFQQKAQIVNETESSLAEARRSAELFDARATVEKARVRMLEAKLRLLRLETPETTQSPRSAKVSPARTSSFLDQKLRFERSVGHRDMLRLKDVQRGFPPFLETQTVLDPRAYKSPPQDEKRISRPSRDE